MAGYMTATTPPFPAHSGSHVMPARPVEPSWVARAPENLGRWAWRWRWQLAPIAGAGGVLTCGVAAPGATLVPLAAVTAGVEVWRRRGWLIAGRKVLSDREKLLAMQWGAGASAWSLASLAHPSLLLAGGLLAGATGWQSWQWGRSRVPKRQKLSPTATALILAWNEMIAVYGPEALRHSLVIRSTVLEPSPGAVSFIVQLAHGVHGAAAAQPAVRQSVESLLKLPTETTHLTPVREDSTKLRVDLAPTRHLESSPVQWRGPLLEQRRTILAGAMDGSEVWVTLGDDSGVRHALVSGTSGAGKSRVLRALVLPEPTAGVGVLVLIDGAEGASFPELKPSAKVYARKRAEWKLAIRAVYAAYLSRKDRRGDAGLTRYVIGEDADPTLTLAIDEAGTVGKAIGRAEHEMVLEMLQQGRKHGIRIVQAVQDPMADEVIGGRKARDLLGGNGLVVALRAGGSMASRLTLDSTGDVQIDLTALPAAPGSCWMIERGQKVVGQPVRCVDAHEEAARAAAAQVVVRDLHADDEAALWLAYEIDAPSMPTQGDDDEPELTAEQAAQSDDVVLRILADADGLTLAQVEQHEDWQWSRRTASNSLMRLSKAGRVEKSGASWRLAGDVVAILDAKDVDDLAQQVADQDNDGMTRDEAKAFLIQSGVVQPINLEPKGE